MITPLLKQRQSRDKQRAHHDLDALPKGVRHADDFTWETLLVKSPARNEIARKA